MRLQNRVLTVIYSRPEIFDGVKLGDEPKVRLPSFAFVIFEEPQSPPRKINRSLSVKRACMTAVLHGLNPFWFNLNYSENVYDYSKTQTKTLHANRVLSHIINLTWWLTLWLFLNENLRQFFLKTYLELENLKEGVTCFVKDAWCKLQDSQPSEELCHSSPFQNYQEGK